MKQYPSYTKYKKYHFVKQNFFALKTQKSFFPANGLYGLQVIQSGKLTYNQVEACRKSVKRNIKATEGFIWLKVFTYLPLTKKGVGSRMGKGKGGHSTWVCPMKSGQIICEVSGFSIFWLIQALKKSRRKINLRSRILKLTY